MTWSVKYGGTRHDDTVIRNDDDTLVLTCTCGASIPFSTPSKHLVIEVFSFEEAPDRESMTPHTPKRCAKCGRLYIGFHQ